MNYLTKVWLSYKQYRHCKTMLHVPTGALPSETYLKYRKESTFNGSRVLNIGCGRCVFPAPNVTNMDLVAHDGVNIAWDLSKTPLPLESDSFDFIIANHVMEHIPNWFDCFKELARVLKPGGRLEVWIPPVSSDSAFTYRDHINWIGLNSFAGCATFKRAGTNLAAAKEFDSDEFGEVKRLCVIENSYRPIVKWWTILAPQWLLNFYATHLRNVISEEGFIFTKI